MEPGKIRDHSTKILGAGLLTGTLVLSPGTDLKELPTPTEIIDNLRLEKGKVNLQSSESLMTETLKSILPNIPRSLSRNEEKMIEQIVEQLTGLKTRATLEGEHLNTTYGLIGAEQHLRRYPGDSLGQHGDYEDQKEGIAPGLGAWGYFAPSKDSLSAQLEETEKWYAVVQTMYLPDWTSRLKYLREWYKYRKVLIINTDNGNAVISAIADSGPAAWTGKHFGGSPEVMDHLGGPKYKKGPVIIFFIDDPENNIPLGPVEYGKIVTDHLALGT